MKVEQLEKLPREMVGDGQDPNVFFVSKGKVGVVMITRDFDTAYEYWRSLPRNVETCLEDRLTGVICSTEPKEDGGKKLTTWDDSRGHHRWMKDRKRTIATKKAVVDILAGVGEREYEGSGAMKKGSKKVKPVELPKPDPITLEQFFKHTDRQYKTAVESLNEELDGMIARLEKSRTSAYVDTAGRAIKSYAEDVIRKEAKMHLMKSISEVVHECFSVEQLFERVGSLREFLFGQVCSCVRDGRNSSNGFSNLTAGIQNEVTADYLRWEFDSYFFFQIKRMYEEREQTREINDQFALQRVLNRMDWDNLQDLIAVAPDSFVRHRALDRLDVLLTDPTIGFPLNQTPRPGDPEYVLETKYTVDGQTVTIPD